MAAFDDFNEVNPPRQSSLKILSDKEKGERALFTLKAIAQGLGSDPRVYAKNVLDSLNEKY